MQRETGQNDPPEEATAAPSAGAVEVKRFIAALVRRERTLLWARVLSFSLLLGLAVVGLVSWAVVHGWRRATAAAALTLLVGVGGWASVALPLLRGWTGAADHVRQARLVEEVAPALRGRLLTAVGHVQGARSGESAALVALVSRRAALQVADIPLTRVHPARRETGLLGLGVLGVAVALVIAVLVPGGPLGLVRYWAGVAPDTGGVALAEVADATASARVGDIVLRYTYPDYTGLDPVEVPNSTGDAHGPPGTRVQVRVRSADPVAAAALVAYDAPPLEAEVVDAREISGAFTVQAVEGAWHLVLDAGGAPRSTRDYRITPESDLPPDVIVDGEDRIELAVDARVDLRWTARDDFGVAKVVLEVDGRESRELRTPRERTVSLSGGATLRPTDLGLAPGDVVDVVVAAWDTDAFSGSKVGRSRVIRLTVLGKEARDRRRDERISALIETMVTLLAEHLEEPWPAGDTSGALASWGERLSDRYAPLEALIDEYWSDVPEWAPDRPVVDHVVETARDLIRYTQISFTPRSSEVPPTASFVVTADLRDSAVAAVEDALLFLDALQRNKALTRVVEQTEEASRLAQQLAEMVAQEDADPLEIASQLDVLAEMLRKLQEQSAQLRAGPLKEFLNQRTEELESLMSLAREALASGDMARAQEMMQRIQRALEQMAEGAQDELSQAGQQGDEAADDLRALDDELARIQEEQAALLEEVQQIREQEDAGPRAQADAAWRALEEVTGRLAAGTTDYAKALKDAGRSFNESERATGLEDAAAQLSQATAARDLAGARREAENTRSGLMTAYRTMEREQRARGALPGPGQADLRKLSADLARVEQLLEQLSQADRQGNPAEAEQLSQLEQRQQQLQQETESARSRGEQISRQLEFQPRGMGESLQQAGDQMGSAGESLQRGEGMGAEGSQGAAGQRIAEARDAIQQAQRQAEAAARARQGQQNGEPSGQGQGQGEQGEGQRDGADDNGQQMGQHDLELPAPEEFRTPEAYREALLQGMEGEVPESFRALKRRYYEELVGQ